MGMLVIMPCWFTEPVKKLNVLTVPSYFRKYLPSFECSHPFSLSVAPHLLCIVHLKVSRLSWFLDWKIWDRFLKLKSSLKNQYSNRWQHWSYHLAHFSFPHLRWSNGCVWQGEKLTFWTVHNKDTKWYVHLHYFTVFVKHPVFVLCFTWQNWHNSRSAFQRSSCNSESTKISPTNYQI